METLESIQTEISGKISEIAKKYEDQPLRISDDIAGPMKYIREIPRYIKESYDRFIFLGLEKSNDLKILDLCTGAGYFIYICNKQHKAVGMDWPQYLKEGRAIELYADLAIALNNTVYNYRIKSDARFRIRRKFDLITAYHPCFDHVKEADHFWGVEDWTEFIEYIMSRHLEPNGRFVLKPLTRSEGASSDEIHDLLVNRYKAKYKSRTFILRK